MLCTGISSTKTVILIPRKVLQEWRPPHVPLAYWVSSWRCMNLMTWAVGMACKSNTSSFRWYSGWIMSKISWFYFFRCPCAATHDSLFRFLRKFTRNISSNRRYRRHRSWIVWYNYYIWVFCLVRLRFFRDPPSCFVYHFTAYTTAGNGNFLIFFTIFVFFCRCCSIKFDKWLCVGSYRVVIKDAGSLIYCAHNYENRR